MSQLIRNLEYGELKIIVQNKLPNLNRGNEVIYQVVRNLGTDILVAHFKIDLPGAGYYIAEKVLLDDSAHFLIKYTITPKVT